MKPNLPRALALVVSIGLLFSAANLVSAQESRPGPKLVSHDTIANKVDRTDPLEELRRIPAAETLPDVVPPPLAPVSAPRNGGPAYLVKDINTVPAGTWECIPHPVTMGGIMYFEADDGINGCQLWKSDGTAAGTVPVQGSAPAELAGTPHSLTAVNGTLYFVAGWASLWKSNGTPAGTVKVKDLNNTGVSLFPGPGGVYFSDTDFTHGYELWRSDGTAAGTIVLKDIYPGTTSSDPYFLSFLNGVLYFGATDATHNGALWKTNGTSAGTVMVKDFNTASPGLTPRNVWYAAGITYVNVDDSQHGELWKTDGTEVGTAFISMIAASDLVEFSSQAFFAGRSNSGWGLWKSDGTGAGTVLVKSTSSAGWEHIPTGLTVMGGWLYMAAQENGAVDRLWKSDGTDPGTVPVSNSAGSPENLAAFGSTLYFTASDPTHGRELWTSDGTDPGTQMVRDIVPGTGTSSPGRLAQIPSGLFFIAADLTYGYALWRTDGSTAGTVPIVDIDNLNNDSGPGDLVNFGGKLYFTAWDGYTNLGLYYSDGTEAGTGQLMQICNVYNCTAELVEFQGSLFFASSSMELSKTDGTLAGTVLVKNTFARWFTKVGNRLFFVGNDSAHGWEVWSSDGTSAGTALVKDIMPGTYSSLPYGEIRGVGVGNILYFAADDGTNGTELWRSDGTEAGTYMIKDIAPGSDHSSPYAFAQIGGTVVFVAYDPTNKTQWWKSDGTAAGTTLLQSTVSATSSMYSADTAYVNGTLFLTASDASHGHELWKTDGTTAGTVLVKDIKPGGDSSIPDVLTVMGNMVYFVADDGTHGYELWRSDGTAQGTVLVKDLATGSLSADIYDLWVASGTLFFTASDPTHGRELWVSDGTSAGTRFLQEIAPGWRGSSPMAFTAAGPHVFFSATDIVHGRELWAMSTYSVTGTVKYSDGQVASGLVVRTDQMHQATTGGDGTYTISGLIAGSYTIQLVWCCPSTPTQRAITLPPSVSGQDFVVGRPVAWLPLVLNCKGGTIYGKITYNGANLPGTGVSLRFYNGSSWNTFATAQSDSNGRFLFTGLPGLSSGQRFYVRYINPGNSQFLSVWQTRVVTAFSSCDNISIGNFDLANIQLSSPWPGENVWLPYMFSWVARGATPSDSYELNLFRPGYSTPYWWTQPSLDYVSYYTLNGLPGGFSPGTVYGWFMAVYSPDGGYGESYYYRTLTFLNAGSTGPAIRPPLSPRMQVESPVPQRQESK